MATQIIWWARNKCCSIGITEKMITEVELNIQLHQDKVDLSEVGEVSLLPLKRNKVYCQKQCHFIHYVLDDLKDV